MDSSIRTSEFYIAGGALPYDALCYVKRPADDELLNSVLAGQFCYVFAAHHMGKSSLMVRTAWRLQQQAVSTATVDLAGFDTGASIDQPYLYLIRRLKFQLGLSIDPEIWWAQQASSSNATQRFIDFLHDVVLTQTEGPIVIFVDGIDSSLNLKLTDSLLDAIRSTFSARETDPDYSRLTFVLLGTATLSNLAQSQNQSLITAGRKIDLREFSLEEAEVLQQGLQAACPGCGDKTFSRILHWTNGHPYLTQRLCQATVRQWEGHSTEEWVDELVEKVFLSPTARTEPNLKFVADRIRTSRRRRQLLNCYRRVYEGQKVPEDERSLDQKWLRILGLVRAEDSILKVRNQIYHLVFDLDWIEANMPVNWTYRIAVVTAFLMLLLAGVLGFSAHQQRQRATEAQAFIESFRATTSPEERLDSLAGLFSLRGQESDARRLFFEELSPTEQLTLFDLDDPRAVGEGLITVVKGIYTDPHLENNQHSNALLGAMAQPLRRLDPSRSQGAAGLELEIKQWLKGREYYSNQGPYQRAINAYDVAIKLNGRNPGTFFDRALAYAAQGELSQALADFSRVVNLDQRWQSQVQHTLINDTQLYTALWGERRVYRPLVALVPTPTSTSTPTVTPLPTSTPTNTPVPVTFTPTAEPTTTPTITSTPTPMPRATATPTSPSTAISSLALGVPSGTFALLNPISLEDPSHGPTDFEWEWTGDVPPRLGFEVRVWREGQLPTGVHNAVLDNQNGNIQKTGGNKYHLRTDIREAAGVQGHSGTYSWTVALVQISPTYADLGKHAEPARLRFEGGSPGEGSDESSGGGVGID